MTQLSATVAGVTYVEVDPAYFNVELYDPSCLYFGDAYIAALVGDFAFAPIFETATPPIAGDAASPTIFSDYLGSFEEELEILTNLGFVTLIYDEHVGLSASISTIPEPSTAILALMGGLGCSLAARRRKLFSAA